MVINITNASYMSSLFHGWLNAEAEDHVTPGTVEIVTLIPRDLMVPILQNILQESPLF